MISSVLGAVEMDFDYVSSLVPGTGCKEDDFHARFVGCQCRGPCTASANCTCLLYHKDTYSDENRLLESSLDVPIVECSEECACALNERPCNNRCIQHGVSLPLEVFVAGPKGRGLRCSEGIVRGRFVIEYVGEVLGAEEVRRRASSQINFVLTVQEFFAVDPSATNEHRANVTYIDPSRRGNLARFINHSCDPNLRLVAVRLGSPLVHVALFALRDIEPLDELTYDYGKSAAGPNVIQKQCHCGSVNCRRLLPASASATS